MLIAETIRDALIEIGVLNPIDEAAPQESEHALRTLNRIIKLYNQQNLVIPYVEEVVIKEPEGGWTRKIKIGNGQQIDMQAPIHINYAFFRDGGTDYKMLEDSLNSVEFQSYKTTSGYPGKYYSQFDSSNNMEIIFNLVPQSGLELHLMAKMPYTGSSVNGYDYTPSDDINWEYGFEKMLMVRLAIELAPSYGVPVSDVLIAKLQEAENIVKAANYKPKTLQSGYVRRRKWPIPSKYLLY